MVEYFCVIHEIEVFFASTYKTTAKIDRESADKIKFLIVGIRDACFWVGIFSTP